MNLRLSACVGHYVWYSVRLKASEALLGDKHTRWLDDNITALDPTDPNDIVDTHGSLTIILHAIGQCVSYSLNLNVSQVAQMGTLDVSATAWQAVAMKRCQFAFWLSAVGHYVWYSLRLNVSEAPPMGTLDVSATVRQAVAMQVPIKNPLGDPLTFDLTYGSEQLVGPHTLSLQAKETCNFEFFFAPLVEGDSQATVTFSSYKVQLLHSVALNKQKLCAVCCHCALCCHGCSMRQPCTDVCEHIRVHGILLCLLRLLSLVHINKKLPLNSINSLSTSPVYSAYIVITIFHTVR